MSDDILIAYDGPIARITLNRPEVRNAMNEKTLARFVELLRAIERNPAIRCVILTGSGGHFMAGGDLNDFSEAIGNPGIDLGPDFENRTLRDGNQFPPILERMPQPVIASIRGGAVGGGAGMALACDFVVASETAYFMFAHARIGLCPDNGTPWYLTRLVGPQRAKRLLMLGMRIDAREALDLGMIGEVVSDEQLEAATEALALQIAAMPALSVARIKHLVNGAARRKLADELQLEAEYVGQCAATPDFVEGVTAFRERRPPRFGA